MLLYIQIFIFYYIYNYFTILNIAYKTHMNFISTNNTARHAHILQQDGYIKDDNTDKNMQVLDILCKSEKGSMVSIEGNGKSAFITEFLKNKSGRCVRINASEFIYEKKNNSQEFNIKTINKLMRSAYSIIFKEKLRIVEGEVIGITANSLTLKTVDMESVFDIGIRIKSELEREKVCIGDIIKVYKDSGFAVKLGRSAVQKTDFNSSLIPVLQLPEGECFKTEDTETDITLDQLDIINSSENGAANLCSGIYVCDNIQEEINKKVSKWKKEDKITVDKGIVIIEDSEMLSESVLQIICAYKNKEYCPLIIFEVNGKNEIFKNISKNIFKIKLTPLNKEKIMQIIKMRIEMANVILEEGAIEHIINIAETYGITYSINILNMCISRKILTVSECKRITDLFKPFSYE